MSRRVLWQVYKGDWIESEWSLRIDLRAFTFYPASPINTVISLFVPNRLESIGSRFIMWNHLCAPLEAAYRRVKLASKGGQRVLGLKTYQQSILFYSPSGLIAGTASSNNSLTRFPNETDTNRLSSTLTIHFLKDRQAVTLDSRTLTACLTFQKCGLRVWKAVSEGKSEEKRVYFWFLKPLLAFIWKWMRVKATKKPKIISFLSFFCHPTD